MGKAQAPKKWNQLYQNLFERRAPAETLDILSRGLDAVTANAGRLIEDATLLVNAQRYGSASFMLATANEEMAKSYILLDMCRLDFARRQSILSNLCHAFYDHVTKYAYTQIVRFSGFRSMAHVKQVWDVNLIKWWSSGDVESGEPDMPHAT
jgi:AbiV family abortive infection protein